MSFFLEFVRDPLTVGAVAPSSPALATVATAAVPRTGSPVVVELGAGTGSFTAAIQQRLADRGRHIAIEVNPRFAQTLAASYPTIDVVQAGPAGMIELDLPRYRGGYRRRCAYREAIHGHRERRTAKHVLEAANDLAQQLARAEVERLRSHA